MEGVVRPCAFDFEKFMSESSISSMLNDPAKPAPTWKALVNIVIKLPCSQYAKGRLGQDFHDA